jgi:hypothetical protein
MRSRARVLAPLPPPTRLRACGPVFRLAIAGYHINPVRLGKAQLRQYCFYTSSETTFLSALCLNFILSILLVP